MPTEEELQQQNQQQIINDEPFVHDSSYSYTDPDLERNDLDRFYIPGQYSEADNQQNAQNNSNSNILNNYHSPDIASVTGGLPWGPGSYAYDRWRKPTSNWPHNKPSLNKWEPKQFGNNGLRGKPSPNYQTDLEVGDYFNSEGIFEKSVDGENKNIYIKNGDSYVLLSDITFTTKNAQSLANIAKYYAPSVGINPNTLRNGNFSVVTFKQLPSNSSTQIHESVSLYNSGSGNYTIGGPESYANYNDKNNTISITVLEDGGHLPSELNNVNNLKNLLYHEGRHKYYFILKTFKPEDDQWPHIFIYYDMITHPTWAKCTDEWKKNMLTNIKDMFDSLVNANSSIPNYQSINASLAKWKAKYTAITGVKY